MLKKYMSLYFSIALLILVSAAVGEQESPLVIESWRWNNQYQLKHIKIEGVVKNRSNLTFRSIAIYIKVKDANGKFLGVGDSWLEPMPLPPGENAIFRVYIDHAICTTNSLNASFTYEPYLLK